MLKKSLIIAAFLAAAVLSGSAYASLAIRQGAAGEMLDAFVLPDGGSLVVSLAANNELFATYTAPDGATTYERTPLQRDGAPDKIFVGVCGNRAHVFANYLSADPQMDGKIDEFVFEFENNLGICENRVHRIALPVLVKE